MDPARAVADFRGERSAWQVSQIVAFGIFSSYVDFAYLIAGVINSTRFFFYKKKNNPVAAPVYCPARTELTFSFFVKTLSYLVFSDTLS